MSQVTRILNQIEAGDPAAAEELLPLVYDELRKLAAAKLANEKSGQTLQATALVHDAYIRLVDVDQIQHWNSRGHFFAAAAEAMRRILVEHARRKGRIRHGHGQQHVELPDVPVTSAVPPETILAIDEAVTRLGKDDPTAASIIKLQTNRCQEPFISSPNGEPRMTLPRMAGDASPSFTAQPQAPAPLHIASHGMQPEEIGWPAICCRRDDIGECVWLGTQAGAFGWTVNDAPSAL